MPNEYPEYYLEDLIRFGRIEEARKAAWAAFEAHKDSPLAEIQSARFQNSVDQTAQSLSTFIEHESRRMSIRQIYTEINGFAWNTDSWHFHWFAYELPVDHPDLDPGNWQSQDDTSHELVGMELIQRAYADADGTDAGDACAPLVILRFMDLILSAVETFTDLPAPVLVSSHDSDYALEIRRVAGKTYLGRQHRHLDTFKPQPIKLQRQLADDSIAVFRNMAFYTEPRWLHRIGLKYLSNVRLDPSIRQNFLSTEPVDPRCASVHPLSTQSVMQGEAWPDFHEDSSYRIVVSDRLLDFLKRQPGSEGAYQAIQAIQAIQASVAEGSVEPAVEYYLLQLLDHRDAVDAVHSEQRLDTSGGRSRFKSVKLRVASVRGCRHLFRAIDSPEIYATRDLVSDLTANGFTGFHFVPVETTI